MMKGRQIRPVFLFIRRNQMMTVFLLLLGTGVFLLLLMLCGIMLAGGLYMVVRGNQQSRISEGRRQFLGGSISNEGRHALFLGMQVAIQIFGSDDLRKKLSDLIQAEDETDSAQEKRRFMKSIVSLLLENRYAWEYGFWEYHNDAETAISSFNQWRNEVESSMATEDDELGSEADRLHRFSDQKEYLVLTLLLLVDNRDEPVSDDVGDYAFRPTYMQLASSLKQACENTPEADTWKSKTFVSLLEAVRALDPRVIERDGIYVYPGTQQDGLSSMDLIGESGWKYLTDHSFRISG
jgi:hypothetical protein